MTSAKIRNAQSFATKAHVGQKYGTEFPYINHVMASVNVATRFGIKDVIILCSQWLHDVEEDTDVTNEDIRMLFGVEIADVVHAVTKPKGMTRKEAAKDTHPRTRQNWRAVIVKLCDQISHVEAGGKKVGMYVKEYTGFKAALIDATVPVEFQNVYDRLWAHLDGLIISVDGIYTTGPTIAGEKKVEVISNGRVIAVQG